MYVRVVDSARFQHAWMIVDGEQSNIHNMNQDVMLYWASERSVAVCCVLRGQGCGLQHRNRESEDNGNCQNVCT